MRILQLLNKLCPLLRQGGQSDMKFQFFLLLPIILLFGCGTLRVEGSVMQPVQATSTAAARLTPTPSPAPSATPVPRLGKVAFVRGGDVWSFNLDTGEQTRLTEGGNVSQPHWSPSGEWLSFFRGNELWIVPALGGAPRRISDPAVLQAVWSLARDELGYTTTAGGLYVSNASADSVKKIVPGPGSEGAGMGKFVWSPDGQWLAFEWTEMKPGALPTWQGLRRIRSDGTNLSELYTAFNLPTRADTVMLSSWSPDGSRACFWTFPEGSPSLAADGVALSCVPAQGGVPTQVIQAMLPEPRFVSWSPNGEQLALISGVGRETWFNKALVIASPDGQKAKTLTASDEIALSPTWAPDARRLAYVSAPALQGVSGGDAARAALASRRIWTIEADGKNKRQLTQDIQFRDEYPLWSRDGKVILFLRLQEQSSTTRASLWTMNPDGAQLRQVVGELSPLPDWFGFYGLSDWGNVFDWWKGPP